jgi:membrane protease YdiL (CAAX protease family)
MDTFLTYARRGQNAWWRYLLASLLAIVLLVVLVAATSWGLINAHLISRQTALDLVNPARPVTFFLGNGVIFGLLVAAFALAIGLIHRKNPLDLLGDWRWRSFALGLGVWTACLCALTLVDVVLRPSGFRWSATPQTGGLALAALFGLGVQTFAEEYVFRGYVTQGLLLATKRPLAAAVLSGLIFGALHIPNGAPQWANATLFGVVAALIAIRTGGLAFTFGMHLINNLFGAIVVVSASDVFKGAPGLFTQATPNLVWSDLVLGVAILAVPAYVALRPAPNTVGL